MFEVIDSSLPVTPVAAKPRTHAQQFADQLAFLTEHGSQFEPFVFTVPDDRGRSLVVRRGVVVNANRGSQLILFPGNAEA